jgi:uncharacterized protein (UPF0333 family)
LKTQILHKMQKRGQLSIEYLMIIGFSLFIITILMLVYSQQTTQQGSEIAFTQVNKVGKKIVDTAQEIFYRGADSRKTIQIYMPANVKNSTVFSNAIVFAVETNQGISELDYPSSVQLQGDLPESQGVKYITVVAKSNFVCVVEQGEPECP